MNKVKYLEVRLDMWEEILYSQYKMRPYSRSLEARLFGWSYGRYPLMGHTSYTNIDVMFCCIFYLFDTFKIY